MENIIPNIRFKAAIEKLKIICLKVELKLNVKIHSFDISNNKFSCNIKGFRKDVHAAYKYLDELFNVSLLAIKIHLNFS